MVKAGFNQRRKTLSNALSGIISKDKQDDTEVWTLRAERLSVADFVGLTNLISKSLQN